MGIRAEGGRVELGQRDVLFRVDDVIGFDRTLAPTSDYYTATADCQRFLIATRAPDPQSPPISIIVNWPSLLDR